MTPPPLSALRVVSAGPGCTLQDGGRHGLLRFGVTGAGPMDPLAHATANLAVGQEARATALEVGPGGLDLEAEDGPVTLAIAGAPALIACEEGRFTAPLVLSLQSGQRLSLRPGASGTWTYVAAAGGLDVKPVLGSTATHTRSHMGGLNGGALKTGDRIALAAPSPTSSAAARLVAPWLERATDVIRVILGPQDDYFAPDQIEAFLTRIWSLSGRSDRMAYLLEGAPLVSARGSDLVSDGVAQGAIQVPGSGTPIVLMADRQPTGGYPKIATIIGADFGAFAQLRAGARFRFEAVDLTMAVKARRAQALALSEPISRLPLVRTHLTSHFLLSLNLVSGVINGLDMAPEGNDAGLGGADPLSGRMG